MGLVYFAKCPKREGEPHPPSLLLLLPGEVNEAVVGLCALREARCSGGGLLPSSLLDEPPRGRRDDIGAKTCPAPNIEAYRSPDQSP